jgi:hypothetical protein
MRLLRPDGALVFLGSLWDQVYSMETKDGWQYHWSVAEAQSRALLRGSYWTISLREIGITCDFIRAQYQGLDEAHAMTTDLGRPLLFVPFEGSHQLIDGWHRLFKAAATGVDVLPALVLTQEDADASLILRLPPGEGLDWGQDTPDSSAQAQP